jgi:hypothetical protein
MDSPQVDVILKRFDSPDEIRVMEKGRFELVRIGGVTIGRATYEPGWRWSLHVGPSVGAERCSVEHAGLVLSRDCDRSVRRRTGLRAARRATLLYTAGPARQLGRG